MASSDSSKTVFLAFSVNFFIAGIKTVIAVITSSSAMFSEAVHSYVDSGNQFILWFGIKQSKKPNKLLYPLGRGKEEYFWTLVVAVLIFTIGGLISLEHGIEALSHPKELKNLFISIAVLSVSIILELYVLYKAVKELRSKAVNKDLSVFKLLKESTDGPLIAIVVEDFAATLGFYIVLTPIFSKYINKNLIQKKNLIGSITGFAGILLIALNDLDQLFGNLFTLICATGYALHIVMVEKYVKDLNISKLMFVQSAVGTILCIPFINYENLNISYKFFVPILFLGFVVNFCAFYLQLFGQKFINASTASLLFGLEGVFALLIGVFFVGEVLNLLNWAGVVLMLVAIFYVVKE